MTDIKQIPQERLEEILAALERAGVKKPCPRCEGKDFDLLTAGYFSNLIQPEPKRQIMEGLAIPTIAVICRQCGFVSQHALGVLGLMPTVSGEGSIKEGGDSASISGEIINTILGQEHD